MLFADDDQARIGVAFENVRKKSAGGLTSGVRINDINLGFGRFERAQIRSKRGFELFADDFKFRLGQKAFELAQHQGMRREEADRKLR